MARIAKRPLKMADGIIVRTIEDLKNNFDIEQVVGYFLDGNLLKWLEARWYEEELEQVNSLDENDLELAKKLCDIFGVEYIDNIEIDTEDIIERKERLLKLKQYTDDEEIIANIDNVAFNQEELADLYDKGVEKIYLCEGDFKIPKSKNDLVYHLIGDIIVDGLETDPIKEDLQKKSYADSYTFESTIPISLADYIGYNTYAELDNFIIWSDYGGIGPSSYLHDNKIKPFFKNKKTKNFESTDKHKIWNINSDEYSSLYSHELSEAYEFYPCGNKIIYRYLSSLYAYDLIYKTHTILYSDLSVVNKEISISNNKIAFYDNSNNMIVLDTIKTKKVFSKKLEYHKISLPGYNVFGLSENYLFYEENKRIIQHNIDNNTSTVLYEFNIPEKDKLYSTYDILIYTYKIIYFNNSLYVFYWDKCDWKSKILKIDLKTNHSIYFDISQDSDFRFFENNTSKEYNSRYLVFYNNKKINVFDMITDELKSYSGNFPSSYDQIHRIGDYLYWGFSKETPSYRVNLNEEWNPVNLEKENSINRIIKKGSIFI